MTEFSPDIVITKSKNPESIENTFATRFRASLLFVKVCVKKYEKQIEDSMFKPEIKTPETLIFFNILASFFVHYSSLAAKSSRISLAYLAFIDLEPYGTVK